MGGQLSLEEKIKKSMIELHELGFQLKQNQLTIKKLKSYRPSCGNGTAIRDAILLGFTNIMKAMIILKQCGLLQQYKFVHIVLTDGDDNRSTTSNYDLNDILNKVKDFCKTFIIGIDMKKEQLPYISKECEYYDVRSSEIENLFNRISISLGLKIDTAVCSIEQNGVEVYAVGQKKRTQFQYQKMQLYDNVDN